MIDDDLELVPRRTVVEGPTEVRFALRPGDRSLVGPGEALVPGARIADRLRDARLIEVGAGPVPEDARPGDRWAPATPTAGIPLRRGHGVAAGELLFELGGHWRMAAGEHPEPVDTPIGGVVHEVRPGIGDRRPGGGPDPPRRRGARRSDARRRWHSAWNRATAPARD